MKVYSWNVYYHNKRPQKQFEYIKNLDFDVFCLQEVTGKLLDLLKTLPHQISYAVDIEFFSKKKTLAVYTVVLSRYPMRAIGSSPIPEITLPSRTWAILRMRSGWTGVAKREFVYADVETDKGLVRIFSLHLALSRPSDRKREFEFVISFLPKKFPAILAGDFNILESPSLKIVNWFFGSALTESVPWHDERTEAENYFKQSGFKNPLLGQITHTVARSQLDHILVPEDAKVLQAEVVKKTHGSDHHPVFVDISIPESS